MVRRPRLRFWALLALSLLTACGSNAGPTALAPSPPAATAPQVATPATASTLPSATRPAPTTVAAQPAAARDIPESITAEGYHVLGRADAPVTLTMYSDFL